jgi:hypothetical protein
MKEMIWDKKKFCGNCNSHNAYNYPDQLFCTKRFQQNQNPIVQTLWCCEKWKESTQECACVAKALAKKK